MASVKVAVRVRPLNSREENMEAKCIIEMEGKRTSILNLKLSSYAGEGDDKAVHGRERVKDFFFDYSYWSLDHKAKHFASQEKIFSDIGTSVLESAAEGYNACIFAYGQTGSGKTHTMMGSSDNQGLIPRICEGLFAQMKAHEDEGTSFRTEVSYLEIYNEKVRDLLRPPPKRGGALHTLRVREHPKEGPYVQGLTKHLVTDYGAIEGLMAQGNSQRTTASTNMNDVSSRSHAIFTISYTQAKFYRDMPSETVSKINLVDLAGSERADATGATGVRLKEGGNINKSLVTLGSVISTLAESSTNPHKKNLFIPYRDSVLTWLLKDSLGGNSKTIMIATISPADCNYAETLSTLRYANRAKNIINKPTVNEDPNVKLIRELRLEIDQLRAMLHQDALTDLDRAAVQKLSENEERLVELTDKWKDRWKETQKIMQERELALQRHQDIGIRMDSELPHLVALEDDLLSTGIILYHLKAGKTIIGTTEASHKPDIVISGPDTKKCHCLIENQNGFVFLSPQPEAPCFVNGGKITKKVKLQQGDVVILGKNNMFRFNHPAEAQELREKRKSIGSGLSNLTMAAKFRSETDLLQKLRTSPDIAREKREEELTKQLEEARNELEKQKHEEERRLEEARHEFARQIREESRRLEETRRELERKKRSRFYEEPTADEIRQQLSELEQRHREAEERRRHREEDLVQEILSKEGRIRDQNQTLEHLERDYEEAKEKGEQAMNELIDHFVEKRSSETKALNEVLRTLVENERNKSENPGKEECIKEEMLAVWREKNDNINRQEKLLNSLQVQYNQKVNEVELTTLGSSIKRQFQREKEDLKSEVDQAVSTLEDLQREKAIALSEFQQDFKNRFDLLGLERKEVNSKTSNRYLALKRQREAHRQSLEVASAKLREAQTQQTKTTKVLNEALQTEKQKAEERRKIMLERRESAQHDFDEKLREFQDVIKGDQDIIDGKKQKVEEKKQCLLELTSAYFDDKSQDKEYLEKEVTKIKVELEAHKRDLKTAEDQLSERKRKIEVNIHRFIQELNSVKEECDDQIKAEDDKITELEQQSREAILLLQEDIDESEKDLLQCKRDIQRDDERLQELRQTEETWSTKLDAELLYIAYLLEREMVAQNKEIDFSSVQSCKKNLEDINERYKEEVQQLQGQNELKWKPIVHEREQAQVVLEDLLRSRGISEVALSELKDKFDRERKIELTEIENLREKLADIEEEMNISGNISRDEVTSLGASEFLSVEEILEKERRRLSDEMERKLHVIESKFVSEMEILKTKEQEQLSQLLSERENLQREKKELEAEIIQEKVDLQREREEREEIEKERLQELERVINDKETQLKVAKLEASREILELRQKLEDSSREIILLQEKLERYVSMTSLALNSRSGDRLSDTEVADLMMRVRGSDDESVNEDSPPEITPPPTPINRFLASVNTFRRNQIKVSIPRYILRGLGRGSYHVFEIKLSLGDDQWSVYRRYRRFRDLHRQLKAEYPVVANLEFPSKRYFGNRAESFVRLRRAQLEAYLKALFAILSNIGSCPVAASIERPLTKQDLGYFHSFFKQGVYEYSKCETE